MTECEEHRRRRAWEGGRGAAVALVQQRDDGHTATPLNTMSCHMPWPRDVDHVPLTPQTRAPLCVLRAHTSGGGACACNGHARTGPGGSPSGGIVP